MSSTDQPQMTRRQRREAKRAATRRRLSRVVGASMVAVLGLGMFTATSAQEAVAGWDDTSRAGATLSTIDFDTKSWRAETDAELERVLLSMGQIMKQTPNDSGFPRERTRELMVDPLSFDRSRHNLSWCRYTNGAWSVMGTTAYSARFYGRDGGIDNVPLTEQFVYTSAGKFFHPATTLAQGHENRCLTDRIDPSRRISSGWIFSHSLGVRNDSGYLDPFVVPNDDYGTYRPEPWKREQADINRWTSERNAELFTAMRQLGAAVGRSPNGERVTFAELAKVKMDPRTFDRSKHNMLYCHYSNGDWSVTATGVATASNYGNLKGHFILTNKSSTIRTATSTLGSSQNPRCDMDGLSAGSRESDWAWSRNNGLIMPHATRDSTWVLLEGEYPAYHAKPWAWEVE